MLNGTDRLSQNREIVMRFHSSRMHGAFKTSAVLFIECVLLFVLSETIARLFLPPGLRVIHPQMLVESNATRIYDHIPNQHAFTIDQPFVTNSMGFRDNREVPLNKAGEIRVLSLGDSMAVGLGVSGGDTYANQLEMLLRRRYDPVRVINGGVGGYSIWQEIDLLKEKGIHVQPDIVLVAFYWNDLYTKPNRVIPLPRNQGGEQLDADAGANSKYLRLLKRSTFLQFLRERLNILWFKISPTFDWVHQEMIFEGRSSPYLEEAYRDIADDLEEFKALADTHGFVPILLVLPISAQVTHLDAPVHMQQRIISIAKKLGLRTLDLLRPLQRAHATGSELFIPWEYVHYSPQGHKVVAEAIGQYLLQAGLVLSSLERPPIPVRGRSSTDKEGT